MEERKTLKLLEALERNTKRKLDTNDVTDKFERNTRRKLDTNDVTDKYMVIVRGLNKEGREKVTNEEFKEYFSNIVPLLDAYFGNTITYAGKKYDLCDSLGVIKCRNEKDVLM